MKKKLSNNDKLWDCGEMLPRNILLNGLNYGWLVTLHPENDPSDIMNMDN